MMSLKNMRTTAFLLLLLQGVVLLSTAADLDRDHTVERQFPHQPKTAPKAEEKKTHSPVHDNPTVPNYNPYSYPQYNNYPNGPHYNNYPNGPHHNNYPDGPHYNNYPAGSYDPFPSKFFFPFVIPYYYYPYAPPYNVYFPPNGQTSGQNSGGQNSGTHPAEKSEHSKPKN